MHPPHFDRGATAGRFRHAYYAAIALLLSLTTLFALSPMSRAEDDPTPAHDVTTQLVVGTQPAIVLVGGGWVGGSSWNGVADRLRRSGYTVDVAPMSLRGLNSDAAQLSRYLRAIQSPVVLVGYSYGGAVITNIQSDSNVKALVYIDAFAPAKGESVLKLAAATPGSVIAQEASDVFDIRVYPAPSGAGVYLTVKAHVFISQFANNLSVKRATDLFHAQRPLTLDAITARSGTPAWKTIPSWYLVGTADRVIPPAEQLFMAKRAHSEITKANTGHLSIISQPAAATNVILRAATSVRSMSGRCDPTTSCVEPDAPTTHTASK